MKKMIVLIAAIAMVAAFAMPAAADVSLYGSARFFTYSVDNSSDWTGTGYSDRDTMWKMGNLTRFGAKFKSGDVSGVWEQDARENVTGSSFVGGQRLRLAYGEWNFGSGSMRFGQDYPVVDAMVSGLNYTTGGLQQWGGVGFGYARGSFFKLFFGNFTIGLGGPYTQDNTVANMNPLANAGYPGTNIDTTLPKIELRYALSLEPVTLDFIGGYQSIDMVNATDQSETVTSYIGAIRAMAKFGPAYLNGIYSYRINGANYGMWTAVREFAVWNGTEFRDTTTHAFALAGGYKISDMLNLELGYGYLNSDTDITGADYSDTGFAYYAQLKVTLAPGVYFIPEFAKFDRDDITNAGVDTKQGDQTVIGAFWKIDFK